MAAECELRLGTLLDQSETQLRETGDLGLGERLVLELGQRLAAPERERLAQEPGTARQIARARLVDEAAGAGEIELAGPELDPVPGWTCLDRLGAERLPQL